MPNGNPPQHGEDKYVQDGDRCMHYKFVRDQTQSGGYPNLPSGASGASGDSTYYLSLIAQLLQPVYEHYASWLGVVIPMDITVPANSQKKAYTIDPAARTIRIETDGSVEIWLNTKSGIPIVLNSERRALYLADLPPKAAISQIFVTTTAETKLFVLAVA